MTYAAIAQELIEALTHAVVQLRNEDHAVTDRQNALPNTEDPLLTTEQAAQFASVSQSYMAKLIDSGAVELHQKIGNQRQVLRSAVIRWQADERIRQAKALKRLAKNLDEEIFSS